MLDWTVLCPNTSNALNELGLFFSYGESAIKSLDEQKGKTMTIHSSYEYSHKVIILT